MNPSDTELAKLADSYLNLTNQDYGLNGPQNLTQVGLLQPALTDLERLMDSVEFRSYPYSLARNIERNLSAALKNEQEEKGRHAAIIAVLDKHLHDFKAFQKRFRELAEFWHQHHGDV